MFFCCLYLFFVFVVVQLSDCTNTASEAGKEFFNCTEQYTTHEDGAFFESYLANKYFDDSINDGSNALQGAPCGVPHRMAKYCTCAGTEFERVDSGTVYKTELTCTGTEDPEGGSSNSFICDLYNGRVGFGPTASSSLQQCEKEIEDGFLGGYGCSCTCTQTSVDVSDAVAPTKQPTARQKLFAELFTTAKACTHTQLWGLDAHCHAQCSVVSMTGSDS